MEKFLLYDFYSPNGRVDEDVYAYSNRLNDERGLIIYHNKFSDTRGWVKVSAAYIDKYTGKTLRRNTAEGLGLPHSGFVIFKDYVSHMEYIRSCTEIWDKGMYFELGAYQCYVFMDWRFVDDDKWKTIYDALNGVGVPSVQDEWSKHFNTVEEVNVETAIPIKKRAARKVAAKKTNVPVASSLKERKAVVKKVQSKTKKAVVKSPVKGKEVASVKAKPKATSSSKAKASVKKTVKAKKNVAMPSVKDRKSVKKNTK